MGMQNLAAILDEWLREFSRGGLAWWVPALLAGIVFLAATWSIGRHVKAILGGK
jgi:hypothetical protein